MTPFRDEVRARAGGTGARIVLPEGDDPRIREAAATLASLGIVPIVVAAAPDPLDDARVPRVAELLRARRPDAVRDGLHALDLAADPLRFAAGLVALGEADGCVAGAVASTADVMRAALWCLGTARPGATVSAATYLGVPGRPVLTFVDTAVVPDPTAVQVAESALAAALDRRALVGDEPCVAFVSYSTRGSAGGASVEKMRAALAEFRRLAPDIAADGEMQVDAALVPEVAARKGVGPPVGGSANVLAFPSLDAANIAYKLVERLAGASAAGPLLQGLARPMSDLSRGARADDIVDVAALVALQAARRG